MRPSKRQNFTQHQSSSKRHCTGSTSRCGFLSLPRELRDQIYELSLVSEKVNDVLWLADGPRRRNSRTKLGLTPAMLRVCRQIYEEGTSTLYGLNTFQVVIPLRWRTVLSDERPGSQLVCTSDRPTFSCSEKYPIKRLIIQLDCGFESIEQEDNDYLLSDVCRAFVANKQGKGGLDMLLLELARPWTEQTYPGAGVASKLRMAHDLCVERIIRYASCVHPKSLIVRDRKSLEGPPLVSDGFRWLGNEFLESTLSARTTRVLPLHLSRINQLADRETTRESD